MVCKVVFGRSLPDDILMVEASSTSTLPSAIMFQPLMIPSNAVDSNRLTVLVQNEMQKKVTIPVGAVLGHLCVTNVVVTFSTRDSN